MIGNPIHNVDASSEYYKLASADERVGLMLMEKGEHKHSILLLIQAMEKYMRAKIFSIVDATNPYFRERERNHALDYGLEFLVEVISGKQEVRDLIKKQLRDYVLGDIRFNLLHNNLRYPFFSQRSQTYSILQVSKSDNEVIYQKLQALKKFIADIDKFR